GPESALIYLQRTLDLEASGGVWLPDQSRKRTPGGVYFSLIRQEVPEEQRQTIFFWPRTRKQNSPGTPPPTQQKTPPQQQRAASAPLTWTQRHQAAEEANQEKGEAKTVKVTLIGRPGKISQQASCIVTSMRQGPTIPALPKGLPLPNQVEPTLYSVYIATKQW